jgi:putative membrane protein
MRGVKDHAHHPSPATTTAALVPAGVGDAGELAAALRETAAELRAVREALAQKTTNS